MARLYIMRGWSMVGFTSPLNCYVNNKLVCQVKNGGDATYHAEGGIIEFRCNLPDSPVSDPIYLDLSVKNLITLEVQLSGQKPQVRVYDAEAVVTSRAAVRQAPVEKFSPTKVIGSYLAVDEKSRQWMVGKGVFSPFAKSVPHPYDDLVDFELLEDGSSITKGGLGSAVVGGLLFGSTGAVVGSLTGKKKTKQTCTNLEIKITLNNAARPAEYIKLITSSTKRESHTYKTAYKTAQDILSLLQLICHQRSEQEAAPVSQSAPTPQSTSPIEELRKYKQLWEEGILSEEEFLAKKRQLLGL